MNKTDNWVKLSNIFGIEPVNKLSHKDKFFNNFKDPKVDGKVPLNILYSNNKYSIRSNLLTQLGMVPEK